MSHLRHHDRKHTQHTAHTQHTMHTAHHTQRSVRRGVRHASRSVCSRIRAWLWRERPQEQLTPPQFPTPHELCDLPEPRISYAFMSSSSFATAWYRMRELGEHDRAAALHDLYTSRRWPGGPFPDPRGASAFSNRAIVAVAARIAGVRVWPMPETDIQQAQQAQQAQPTRNAPRKAASRGAGRGEGKSAGKEQPAQPARQAHQVWLITYPMNAPLNAPLNPFTSAPRPDLDLATIAVAAQPDEERMLWYVAQMLGVIAREPERVRDHIAPAGVISLPNDPVVIALLHRYAKALLNVAFECSARERCPCAEIEQRLNYPPADHEQPTVTAPALSTHYVGRRMPHNTST